MNRLDRSLKATFVGMAVNAVLTASKFAAGILGHSHALTADAVESTADIFSSIIMWRGLVVAAEPADPDHPYGHGKAEPLAAASVAIMLLLAAVGIMARSAQGLFEYREMPPRAFTLGILIAVVVVKEALFRFVSREAGKLQSIALLSDAWHHRTDAITSLAAGLGITLALFGGQRLAFADDGAAIIAGAIIAWNGWRLLRPALQELMDAAPDGALVSDIRKAAGAVPGVNAVEKCIVRKMGFQHFVDMHVEVDPRITVQQGHQIAHNVKDKVRAVVPSVYDVLVHIEPSQN
ncbi:MAG: cation diffusion facilitator family transporter [Verrucomicrobiota bacterium]|jgi:cation diffusion facilitator family transporter